MTTEIANDYTGQEVAKLLNLSIATVYAMGRDGRLAMYRIADGGRKQVRFSREGVDRLLEHAERERAKALARQSRTLKKSEEAA